MNQLPKEAGKLYTIPKAAAIIGVKPHALRRAVKKGLVPSYSCFNSRALVCPAEVAAAMAAYANGGQQ